MRRATSTAWPSTSNSNCSAYEAPIGLAHVRSPTTNFARACTNVLACWPLMRAHTPWITRRQTNCLWRVVALCFLAFTAYELFLGGTCGPELLGFPPDLAVHAEDSIDVRPGQMALAMSPATKYSPHDHSDEAGCSTEDCFCCCAHISVSGVYVVSMLEDAFEADVVGHVSLPTGPSASLFRPPRNG